MNDQRSFKRSIKCLFLLLCGIFAVAEITAIMGILGIGNKVFQISFHLIILLVLIVLFVLGYRYLAERFVDPLLEMDIAVKALAKGDLSVKVTYESDNELGRLSGSLGRLPIC